MSATALPAGRAGARPRAATRVVWAVGALTALAAALRFSTLGLQSYWYNEAATVVLAKMGFGSMLGRIPTMEGNPPLYYVLAWLWAKPFGTGEVGLRALSALAGTAMVPVTYLAGARLAGRRTGLVVAALAACSPILVWYSQEARPYILLALLTALALIAFLRALETGARCDLAWWTALSALALATHYFALVAIVPQAAVLLWRSRRERSAIVAVAVIVGVAGALLPIALRQSEPAKTSIPGSFGTRLLELPKQLVLGFDAPAEIALSVTCAILILIGVGLAFTRADFPARRGALLAGGLGAAGVILVLLGAVVGLDYLNTRNLIEVWLPLALVPAVGLAARRASLVGPVGAVALCVIGTTAILGVDLERPYQRDDWRGAVHALGRARGVRAIVVTPANGVVPLRVYLPRARPMSANGAVVSEIDLVGMAERSRQGQPPRPPRPKSLFIEAPGQVSTFDRDRMFTVVRFTVAPGGALVTPVRLGPSPIGKGAAAILLEPAG